MHKLRIAVLVFCFCTAFALPEAAAQEGASTFHNPLYSGADPWVIRDGGQYYYCWSSGTAIYVSASPRLTERGPEKVVWMAAGPDAWNAYEVWAPELHKIGSRWYIYYAADNGRNENHRMGVLESVGADPLGDWVEKGRLYTGDRWAIDGTVLEHGGKLYFIWSGWPGSVDGQQNLYIAPMDSPVSITAEPVLLARPEKEWETRAMPLLEGPQVLKNGAATLIVYSASGSWTPDYCLGGLELKKNGNPLDPKSWTKFPRPLFSRYGDVFGPGHASFTTSPDGKEWWILYHAKTGEESGWNRVVRAQRFTWKNGRPVFGKPVQNGVELKVPSGQK